MSKLTKIIENCLHDEQVRRRFPRTRARFTTWHMFNDMHSKGAINLKDTSAQQMSFDEWKASRPISLED